MTTRLIEFSNSRDVTLRGILVQSKQSTSQTAIVCVPGFECVSSTAPKFVHFTNALLSLPSNPIASVFRYDPTGIGLSDGDYQQTTIETLVDDLSHAVSCLSALTTKFTFIGHSLGSWVIARYIHSRSNQLNIDKIILLAPALNQYDLRRYWFMREKNPHLTWKHFQETFRECDFQNYLDHQPIGAWKTCRAHRISYDFVRSCAEHDYSSKFENYQDQILHIHPNRDSIVPLESLNNQFKHRIILDTNDHDLEQPDILQKWMFKAMEFICD